MRFKLPMCLDAKHMLVALECVEDLDLTHLLLTVTCANVLLLGLLHDPDLAASWRPTGRSLDRLADAVHCGELTLAAIKRLDIVEAGAQCLIDIILCEADGDGALDAAEEGRGIARCCGCGGPKAASEASVEGE